MYGYDIFPELRLIRFYWKGPVTGRQAVEASLACLEDPEFDPFYRMSMDMTGGLFWNLREDLEELIEGCARYYGAFAPDVVSAIYAPDDITFGQAQVYATMAAREAPYPVRVFRLASDALEFLGIAADHPSAERVFRRRAVPVPQRLGM